MGKIKTLVVTDEQIKATFKSECAKNGKDMSEVTESLWARYNSASMKARAERYKKIKQAQDERKAKRESTE